MISNKLEDFAGRNVVISLGQNGKLSVSAPEGIVTNADVSFLREHKQEIITELEKQKYQGVIAPGCAISIDNVFDSESGNRAVAYLLKLETKGQNFNYNSRRIEAYLSEQALVEGIGKHSQDRISDQDLKTICDLWVKNHNGTQDEEDERYWTGKETPLFTLNLYCDDEVKESVECNFLQLQLIGAILQVKAIYGKVEIIPQAKD